MSSPWVKPMGRGTACNAVEGQLPAPSPSTMLRMVPLPIAFSDREENQLATLAA